MNKILVQLICAITFTFVTLRDYVSATLFSVSAFISAAYFNLDVKMGGGGRLGSLSFFGVTLLGTVLSISSRNCRRGFTRTKLLVVMATPVSLSQASLSRANHRNSKAIASI